jgi:MYXO-CTERM domain-containing protein
MAFRATPSNWPRFAALVMLGLLAAALTRRRFRLAVFLFHLVVAFGESWSDRRARRRVAKVLTSPALADAGLSNVGGGPGILAERV